MRKYEKEIDGSYFCIETIIHKPNKYINDLFCSHTLKICLVWEGKGVWDIAGKAYNIQKGDIFILGNNDRRKIEAVYPPDDMKLIILEFEPRFIWSNTDEMLESGYLSMFFKRNEKFDNRIEGSLPVSKEISALINQIDYEFEKKVCEYKLMIKVKLLNILVLLKRHFSMQVSNDSSFISAEQRMLLEKTIDHININYTNEITLKDLSKMALMSASKFSRLFKKLNGINVSQYIVRMRVNNAVYKLVNTNDNVLDIALSSGFNNSANFYKAFKNVTGKSPKDFR